MMYCKQCGQALEDGAKFCTNCGASQQTPENPTPQNIDRTVGVFGGAPVPPVGEAHAANFNVPQSSPYDTPAGGAARATKPVGFGEAIKLFFVNYVNFEGRTTRSEYWWAFLFSYLVGIAAGMLGAVIPYFSMLVSLGMFLPGLSMNVRRLHDIGKPWPYLLMGLIPLAGPIILIVFYCKPSDGDNAWGRAR